MPRVIGLDYGSRRLGFAMSDPTEIIATPLRVEHCSGDADALEKVLAVCAETAAAKLVVGMPLNMDGTHGPQAVRVAAFVDRLRQRMAIPIVTWDERLSSRAAEHVLIDAGASRKRRKEVIDKLAAQIVLQSYLDAQGFPMVPGEYETD